MSRYLPDRFAALVRNLTSLPRETEWVEFKENNANPAKIGENISALSNAAALNREARGYVIWGLQDKTRSLVGTSFVPEHEKGKGNEDLKPWLIRNLHPQPEFRFHREHLDGVPIVLLEIAAASSHVVRFESEAYIRVGSYTKKLKDHPEMERRLWDSLRTIQFEGGIAAPGVPSADVFKLLDVATYYGLMRQRQPGSEPHVLAHLAAQGMVCSRADGDFDISNLGAIALANRLSDFGLGRKALRVVSYRGTSRGARSSELEMPGGYASQFTTIRKSALDATPQLETLIEGIRQPASIYPELAVRELLVNSLIHQDFSIGGSGPLFEVFSDRVEFTNPGTPLIPTNRFLDTPPQSRNEKLAGLLRQLGICEERGSGVDKVIMAIEAARLPPPIFRIPANNTQVVLFAEKSFADLSRDDRVRACYQHASIQWANSSHLTNESLRKRFGLSADKASLVSRVIKDTVAAGQIVAEGGRRKSARYLPFYALGDTHI